MKASIAYAIRRLETWQKGEGPPIALVVEEVLTQLYHAVHTEAADIGEANDGITHLAEIPRGCAGLVIRRASLDLDSLGYALAGSVSGQTYATSESAAALLHYARTYELPVSCLFDLRFMER
jgi:hypothetical protein